MIKLSTSSQIISVVIPTCNRPLLLQKCLEKLVYEISLIQESNIEIIVSDDSLESTTQEMVAANFPIVKWISGPRRGPAANRNNGAKLANGEWLLFLDDDCIPSNYLVRSYFNSISKHISSFVFEGSIKADRHRSSLIEESPINEAGGCLWSCNFMIHRKVFFEQLGGFDENFIYAAMEDVDLAYRIKKASIPILFLPEAAVVHPWRKQYKLITATIKRYKAAFYFFNKHPEKLKEVSLIGCVRTFYNHFGKDTLRYCIPYRFSGFGLKVFCDFLHLFYCLQLYRQKLVYFKKRVF